jgi:hypothetical protein
MPITKGYSMNGKSLFAIGFAAVTALMFLNCGDASKAQTNCIIKTNIVVVNKDAIPYTFTISDTTQWDSLDEVSLKARTVDPAPSVKHISADTSTIEEITIKWSAEHYLPWDESICSRDGEEIMLQAKVTRSDTTFKDTTVKTQSNTDSTYKKVSQTKDTMFARLTIPITCNGCVKTYSDSVGRSDSSSVIAEERYTCFDTVVIDQ